MNEFEDAVCSSASFLFAINSCFTISGRGTVVGGDILIGAVRGIDVVDLVHNTWRIRTKCLGIDFGHGRNPDGSVSSFVGLWLAGVRKFEVVPGDYVSSPGAAW